MEYLILFSFALHHFSICISIFESLSIGSSLGHKNLKFDHDLILDCVGRLRKQTKWFLVDVA